MRSARAMATPWAAATFLPEAVGKDRVAVEIQTLQQFDQCLRPLA